MAYDSVTTAAMADELRASLVHGRVDKVIQPSASAVALLVRAGGANHWLLLSAHPQHARVALTSERLAKAFDEPSAFVMLLRKHLEGASLADVAQVGRDRILRLTFRSRGPHTALIAEVMGKHSNIILVDEKDTILGALKRITPAVSRRRVVLPHERYALPPAQTQPPPREDRLKLDPLDTTPDALAEALGARPDDAPLATALVDVLAGVSPQLAREVAYRLSGAVDVPLTRIIHDSPSPTGTAVILPDRGQPPAGWKPAIPVSTPLAEHGVAVADILDLLRALMAPEGWGPSIARRDGKTLGWAAYPLRQHEIEPTLYPTVSDVLDQAYTGAESGDALGSVRAGLRAAIGERRARLAGKIASLRAGLRAPEEIDRLRLQGEMVLAFAHDIVPGQGELRLDDPPLVVPLDPTLTPAENAQALFARYRKARDAAAKVPPLLVEAEEGMEFLDAALVFVDQADAPQALREVKDDLAAAGFAPTGEKSAATRVSQKGKGGKYHPGGKEPPKRGAAPALRFTTGDGLEVLVGRSARQNEEVTFRLATGGDLWFHARGVPGSHVVLKTAGRTPPDTSVEQAAELAAYYSRGRGSTTVPVDVVPARSVRRVKGGKPGLVRISGETTVNVRPRPRPGDA